MAADSMKCCVSSDSPSSKNSVAHHHYGRKTNGLIKISQKKKNNFLAPAIAHEALEVGRRQRANVAGYCWKTLGNTIPPFSVITR